MIKFQILASFLVVFIFCKSFQAQTIPPHYAYDYITDRKAHYYDEFEGKPTKNVTASIITKSLFNLHPTITTKAISESAFEQKKSNYSSNDIIFSAPLPPTNTEKKILEALDKKSKTVMKKQKEPKSNDDLLYDEEYVTDANAYYDYFESNEVFSSGKTNLLPASQISSSAPEIRSNVEQSVPLGSTATTVFSAALFTTTAEMSVNNSDLKTDNFATSIHDYEQNELAILNEVVTSTNQSRGSASKKNKIAVTTVFPEYNFQNSKTKTFDKKVVASLQTPDRTSKKRDDTMSSTNLPKHGGKFKINLNKINTTEVIAGVAATRLDVLNISASSFKQNSSIVTTEVDLDSILRSTPSSYYGDFITESDYDDLNFWETEKETLTIPAKAWLNLRKNLSKPRTAASTSDSFNDTTKPSTYEETLPTTTISFKTTETSKFFQPTVYIQPTATNYNVAEKYKTSILISKEFKETSSDKFEVTRAFRSLATAPSTHENKVNNTESKFKNNLNINSLTSKEKSTNEIIAQPPTKREQTSSTKTFSSNYYDEYETDLGDYDDWEFETDVEETTTSATSSKPSTIPSKSLSNTFKVISPPKIGNVAIDDFNDDEWFSFLSGLKNPFLTTAKTFSPTKQSFRKLETATKSAKLKNESAILIKDLTEADSESSYRKESTSETEIPRVTSHPIMPTKQTFATSKSATSEVSGFINDINKGFHFFDGFREKSGARRGTFGETKENNISTTPTTAATLPAITIKSLATIGEKIRVTKQFRNKPTDATAGKTTRASGLLQRRAAIESADDYEDENGYNEFDFLNFWFNMKNPFKAKPKSTAAAKLKKTTTTVSPKKISKITQKPAFPTSLASYKDNHENEKSDLGKTDFFSSKNVQVTASTTAHTTKRPGFPTMSTLKNSPPKNEQTSDYYDYDSSDVDELWEIEPAKIPQIPIATTTLSSSFSKRPTERFPGRGRVILPQSTKSPLSKLAVYGIIYRVF